MSKPRIWPEAKSQRIRQVLSQVSRIVLAGTCLDPKRIQDNIQVERLEGQQEEEEEDAEGSEEVEEGAEGSEEEGVSAMDLLDQT